MISPSQAVSRKEIRGLVVVAALALMSALMAGPPDLGRPSEEIVIPADRRTSWWVGVIEDGFQMPLAADYRINTIADNHQNQVEPLILSDRGDVLWSGAPFDLSFIGGQLRVKATGAAITRTRSGDTLRDAYLSASRLYFHFWAEPRIP